MPVGISPTKFLLSPRMRSVTWLFPFNRMTRTLKATMEELYVLNNKLQDLNRHYLEMVGFITHELNQPMGVLKGYLILLQDESQGP